ncbi:MULTISPECIES: endonuclease V [unclassified Streptomyces]|uniref:endonuclease V n=1 Tax=unclassified Streptomyces TaxID=2593676 RepID=UPI0022B684F6|nr:MULTISPECIES: endonuclease V [unclassified Streptomyces]MCZ7415798.1 endonuclease V [Streptomyces sp. WMMC897]MCZ7434391.1 endonuclease V [Streptomyces sp. WMMC1477]
MTGAAATHTTPASEEEALAVQRALRSRVVVADEAPAPGQPGTLVAGVDVAYDDARNRVAAAVVVLDAVTLEPVEEATSVGPVAFPYVPGLLAFRELPGALAALGRLRSTPGLVVCDGYGLAHPRRFGLASHLGVLTGLPTIGVAKNPFGYRHGELGRERGAVAALMDGAEEVGAALRTRQGVKPLYVSVGHRTTLDAACAHVLRLARDHRQPETTRRADRLCRLALSRAAEAAPG